MTENRRRLDRWVRQQAFHDDGDVLVKFVIKHAPSGNKGNLVGELKVEKVTTDDVGAVAEALEEMVKDDAAGFGGMQRYVIEAWFDGCNSPSARMAMRVEGYDPDIDGTEGDAEPATKGGALAQQMRHNEVLMKAFVGGMGSAIQSLQRMAAKSAEQVEALMSQRLKDFQTIEEAQSRKHERDMDMLAAEEEARRKEMLIEKGLLLVPALMNKLTGSKAVAGPNPRELMMKGLIETLTPAQLNGIMSNLAPEQQIVLLEFLKAFKADEESDVPPNGS